MKNCLYLGFGTALLAAIGTLVKLIGNSIHPFTLMFYRVALAFLFLLVVVPFLDKNAFKLNKRDARNYFLVGFLWTVSATMFVSANLFAPVQNVTLIHSIYPFFVFIFASILLREKVTKTKVFTAIIAFIGLAIINPFQTGGYEIGNLLSLGSGVI